MPCVPLLPPADAELRRQPAGAGARSRWGCSALLLPSFAEELLVHGGGHAVDFAEGLGRNPRLRINLVPTIPYRSGNPTTQLSTLQVHLPYDEYHRQQ